jgi:hypothetical protein
VIFRPEQPWVPPSLLYNGYRVFPGGKRSGRGVDHPALSSAEVKERVELHFYSSLHLRGLFYGEVYLLLYLVYTTEMNVKGVVHALACFDTMQQP